MALEPMNAVSKYCVQGECCEFGDEGNVFVPCAQYQVLLSGNDGEKQDLDNYGFERESRGS